MTMRSLSRTLRSLTLAVLIMAAAAAAHAAGYYTQAGHLYGADGQEIQIRGISHFGFNSTILQPEFLWSMGWKAQIAQIKSLGFNAVRLPFVPDTLYSTTPVDQLSYIDPALNPELLGKTPLQVLDLWMAEADRQGLYVMLDFHSVSMQRQYPTWFVADPADFGLVYNHQAYTPANWLRDLAFVAKRYAALPHFLAIDVYNEPNGVVRWSTGDANASNPANFWKPAVESAAAAVLAANPNLLVFVQGITANFDGIENSNIPMNWGENFQPEAYQPLAIPASKLVLSPHTYGPDVYAKSSFSAAGFPANLAADWETLFGQFAGAHPVVTGEWGGRYGNGAGGAADITWQNAFVDYLLSQGIHSSFYWCYTSNSGDTGGILDDNLNVRQDKMALLRRLWAGAPPAAAPPPAPAPTITGFVPASGPAGTVVTIIGRGFAGVLQAWVGGAHNAGLSVVSDAEVRVTVPAGATSGAIGLLTGTQAAFTASAFTVTTPVPPAVKLPSISSFAPGSGPAGSVVTLIGTGFTGVSSAWAGNAHNAGVLVISDSKLQVTIPAGATTGAIGIFNPLGAAFTATSFTVTVTANGYPQPYISAFTPSSGPAGTVVTITGSGFTGLNQAWAGNAHNAGLRILSDTQVQVTIPAGGTTGAIGILNPQHAAFTPSAYAVK